MPRKIRHGIQLKKARLSLTKFRYSRSIEALRKRVQHQRMTPKNFINHCITFSEEMTNNKGCHHTNGENKLLMYVIIATFRRTLKSMYLSSLLVNWNTIEKEVADDFHVSRRYIWNLRETFHKDGEILTVSDNQRGFPLDVDLTQSTQNSQ